MNSNEEKLRQDIEAGNPLEGSEADVRSYESVFRGLVKEPGFELPASFADRVVQRVIDKQTEKGISKDFFWLGAGVFLLVTALVAALAISFAYLGFRPNLGFLSSMADYKGLFALTILLIIIFNRLEKKLIITADQNRKIAG